MREVRVRFAPSPTGPLHIGGVRTALYNYLFARQHNGKFILRIEDTDQTRHVPSAEQYILDSLIWSGIHFDEGPHLGGPYAPYRQSERKEIYYQYALQLLQNETAYYAFDTTEDLDIIRKEYELRKGTFQYGPQTRIGLKNSLTLPESEVTELLDSKAQYVIRIKIPENEFITVNDLIRGTVKVDSSLLDDKVLYKSDGMPTYHLANVVDDYLMRISHVIRGEEWLPSAPLHVLLYRYFGWEKDMPQFAHLPLILKPEGNGKLSKRDGDRLGFPVFPLCWSDPKTGTVFPGYRENGYLPEAFINMLAFLGWNPGTEQELFTLDELVKIFTIERISKSGAKFDIEKAHWYNHQYLAKKSPKELATFLIPILIEKNIEFSSDYVEQVCALIHDRAVLIPDLWTQSQYFFKAPEMYDKNVVSKIWKSETPGLLIDYIQVLETTEPFIKENIEHNTRKFFQNRDIPMGQLMNPFRLAVVGTNAGPGMFAIAEVIGKAQIIYRLRRGIEKIPV